MCIRDRLLGVKNGIDTVAVFTGETNAEEISLSHYKPKDVYKRQVLKLILQAELYT